MDCKFKFAVWFLLLSTSRISADESSLNELSQLSLAQLLKIEITASTLTKQSLSDVPSSVTTFSGEQIRALGIDDLTELMNYVPSFQSFRTAESGGIKNYSVRGRRLGNQTREILILINGQRLATDLGSGGQLSTLPLFNISQVEFIRGPGSAIYGSNAFLGVINIKTQRTEKRLGVYSGSYNQRKAQLQFFEKSNNFDISMSAHYQQDDGAQYLIMDTFSNELITTHDPLMSKLFESQVRWKEHQIQVYFHTTEAADFYIAGTTSNGFNLRKDQILNFAYQYSHEWNENFRSEINISQRWFSNQVNRQLTAEGDLFFLSQPASDEAVMGKATIEEDELRLWWHNHLNLAKSDSLQFGMEFRQPELTQAIVANNFDIADLLNNRFPVPYYGEFLPTTQIQSLRSRDVLGLYAQYLWKINSQMTTTLGARYDNYSDIKGHMSPRLAVVYELSLQHSFKLLYGSAFRAPSSSEMYLVNNPVSLGNPDLKPETVNTWEVIWQYNNENWLFNMTFFNSVIEEPIIQLEVNSTSNFVNGTREKIHGSELEVITDLSEHWRLRGTYTRFFDKPVSSFRESENMASLIIDYNQDNYHWNLSANYQSEKSFPVIESGINNQALTNLDGTLLINSKFRYQFNPDWQLSIQLKNGLDETYFTPSRNAIDAQGIPNRGREWLIGVSHSF